MLKLDLYTRIILTIIAICLVVIAFRPALGPQPAQASGDVTDVNLNSIGGWSISAGELPIRITQPVTVQNR